MKYRVHWDIDVEADSPYEAAQQALEIHRDPQSTATVFVIEDEDGRAVQIDFNPND